MPRDIRPCKYCGELLYLCNFDGWEPPAWVPDDGEHSRYCEGADDNEHTVAA